MKYLNDETFQCWNVSLFNYIRVTKWIHSTADSQENRHPEEKSYFTGCEATPLAQNQFQLIPESPPPGNVARLPCGGIF